MQILFTGDVMLGRLVNEVLANSTFSYVWGNTIDIIRKADFSLINLECAISSRGKEWNKTFKMFHFRANLDAIKVLKSAYVDYASLANNHVLDYDNEALVDTINFLNENNISHSGAGINLKEALEPAFIEKKIRPQTNNVISYRNKREYQQQKKQSNNNSNMDNNKNNNDTKNNDTKNTIRIAIISLTDNEPIWEAKGDSAGINYIPISLKPQEYYYRLKNCIEEARKKSDLLIVSSHVGPHFRETPSTEYVDFAHSIIDFGADIYWGHSNHMPQGIEVYKPNNNDKNDSKSNKIIIYDSGDFIDDYAIDSYYRNDLSFIFVLHFNLDGNYEFSNNNNMGNTLLQNGIIELIPTRIRHLKVDTISADDNDADLIIKRMVKKCLELGTKCFIDEKKKRIIIFL